MEASKPFERLVSRVNAKDSGLTLNVHRSDEGVHLTVRVSETVTYTAVANTKDEAATALESLL